MHVVQTFAAPNHNSEAIYPEVVKSIAEINAAKVSDATKSSAGEISNDIAIGNARKDSTETNGPTNGHATNGTATELKEDDSFKFRDSPAWTARKKLRVVTAGAGFSGLTLAYKLQHQYPEMQEIVDHQIYELYPDIGGTWLVNTYPGVQCDVPAHVYAFPFDPNPDWSHFYATGEEIEHYIKKTAKKWNLTRDVKLNHKIVEAIWFEDRSQWRIKVKNPEGTFTDWADIFVSGAGVLNAWKWPEIEGLHAFKGHLVHTAAWKHDYDYNNKRIAMIGNGSSGVQVLPQLAKLPGTHIKSFQRSSNWVYTHLSPASLLGKDDKTPNPAYTEEEKRMFRENPEEHKKYRKLLIENTNKAFPSFIKGSEKNKIITERATQQMKEKLKDNPNLCKTLIPDWPLGCRRITPAEGYLETFHRDNVELVTQGIVKITENGILTADGKEHEIDTLVCATGYAADWKPRWAMIGRNQVDLVAAWHNDPHSYLSMAAPDMPNYFIFLGSNAVGSHGSLVEAVNWNGDYIIKWLKKIATEDIASVCPKKKVVEDLIKYGDSIMQRMVWTAGCRSWFKKHSVDGRNAASWPGSAISFRMLVSEIRPEDFDIQYRSNNTWWFFGNGFTSYELDEKNDLAWYVQK